MTMTPCSACGRLLRGADATCPFCGQRHRAVTAAIALVGLALGCGPAIDASSTDGLGATSSAATDSDATGASSSGHDATTSPTGSTTFGGQTETGDDASTTVVSASAIYGGPIGDPDGGGITIECSVWNQDCANGEKCMPWANDAGSAGSGGSVWNAARCVPLNVDPHGVGEPCTAQESFVSGFDTCDAGAICMGSNEATLEGVCVELCSGSTDDPVCDETDGATCLVDEIIPLCLSMCDPLLEDCGEGQACTPWADTWTCMTEGDILPGAPCLFDTACVSGALCVPADASCPRGTESCCTSLCDLGSGDADAPCIDGQSCVAFYGAGEAPEGHEDVGVCTTGG